MWEFDRIKSQSRKPDALRGNPAESYPHVSEGNNTPGLPIARKASCACGGGCPGCSGDARQVDSTRQKAVQTPRLTDRPGHDLFRLFSGQSACSPTWYGDTSAEPTPDGNSLTGRLIVTYNDAVLKDPCVRECVEQHEAVHVEDFTPLVKRIHDCDVAAGNDWDKKEKCAEINRELVAARARSECRAYRRSFTCLTYKILDSSNPCSKSPHREEIQKHRGYEACEMKRQCADAGTPEAGIPNA